MILVMAMNFLLKFGKLMMHDGRDVCVYCVPVPLSRHDLIVSIKEPLFSVDSIKGIQIALLGAGDLPAELVADGSVDNRSDESVGLTTMDLMTSQLLAR